MAHILQFGRVAFALGLTAAVIIASIAFPPHDYHSVRTGGEAWFIAWIVCAVIALAGLLAEALINEREPEGDGFISVAVFVALGLTAYLMSWMLYGLWPEKVAVASARDAAPLMFCGLMAALSGLGFIGVLGHYVHPLAKRIPILVWRS